jgi:hypothetical protein
MHAVDNPFPKTAARPSCINHFRKDPHIGAIPITVSMWRSRSIMKTTNSNQKI